MCYDQPGIAPWKALGMLHTKRATDVVNLQCRRERMPPWLGAALVGGTCVALVWLESRRPLRDRRAEPKLRRNVRNLAVAATAAAAVQLAEKPLTAPLTRL